MSVEQNVSSGPNVDYFAVIYPCPACGEKAGTTFSRVVCACSMMHNYCEACGVQADPCWDEALERMAVEVHDACGCKKCHPEIHNGI